MPGVLRTTERSVSTSWTHDEFVRLREGARRMQVEAALTGTAPVRIAAGQGDAIAVGVAFVSGEFFPATGARVALGRPLRTQEMGIRAAIGARPRDLLRLVVGDSLRPVVLGLAIGAGAALLAGRFMTANLFFGVPPQDPIAPAGAGAVLLVAATLAVLTPARRAVGIDAAAALRRG